MAVYATLLRPTAAGMAIDASGRIEIRARHGEQHFEVGMDVAVADGTTFIVLVNGRLAGTMTVLHGAGNLHLRDLRHILPEGMNDPIRCVWKVEARASDGTVVLESRA